MSVKQKLLIAAALILFLSVPVLIYQYYDLSAIAHDRQRCADARADFIKYSKYSHTTDFGPESKYCEQLDSEAWTCRYAAIIFFVLGGYCLYTAFKK
jgi:hypothetical protein